MTSPHQCIEQSIYSLAGARSNRALMLGAPLLSSTSCFHQAPSAFLIMRWCASAASSATAVLSDWARQRLVHAESLAPSWGRDDIKSRLAEIWASFTLRRSLSRSAFKSSFVILSISLVCAYVECVLNHVPIHPSHLKPRVVFALLRPLAYWPFRSALARLLCVIEARCGAHLLA